jgi:hypothetical protein
MWLMFVDRWGSRGGRATVAALVMGAVKTPSRIKFWVVVGFAIAAPPPPPSIHTSHLGTGKPASRRVGIVLGIRVSERLFERLSFN